MQNYNNVIIISADRNGSTAFQHQLLRQQPYNDPFENYNIDGVNPNNDSTIWLGECFTQEAQPGQPPPWYNPNKFTPKQTIETINIGTGKPVLVKIQITHSNFNDSFLDIIAKRKIFFHRNLFDSTLSKCIGKQTGKWWWHSESDSDKPVVISEKLFSSKLEWRIKQYDCNIDKVIDWANEVYIHENYNYNHTSFIKRNKDKKKVVKNYNDLYKIYEEKKEIIESIENRVLSKVTND